jgi:hypothetical protein
MSDQSSWDRIAAALEKIAEALDAGAKIEAKRYAKEFPEVKVNEATVGQARYRKINEDEGQEENDFLGPRERKLTERLAKKARQSKV